MLRFILSILMTTLILKTHSETIEWTFNKSNIKDKKFVSENPLATGTFTAEPRIQNNALILDGKSYLALDSTPKMVLEGDTLVLEAICNFYSTTHSGQGVIAFSDRKDKTMHGFVLGRWQNRIGVGFAYKRNENIFDDAKIKFNEWMHLFVTKDSKEIKLYVNSKLIGTRKVTEKKLFPKNGSFTIGSYFAQGGGPHAMPGAIHYIKISDKMPSSAEIQNSYKIFQTKLANDFVVSNTEQTYKKLSYIFLYLAICLALLATLKHAGYEGFTLIVAFIPPIAPILLAFATWPVENEINKAQKKLKKLED